jgi:hypothetical protein
MLSAVTAKGALRFMVHEGTVNAEVFIGFCKRLLADASCRVTRRSSIPTSGSGRT